MRTPLIHCLLATAPLAACVTPPRVPATAPDVDDAVASIAQHLVDAAELRIDPSAMRICVPPLEMRDATPGAPERSASELAALRAALQHELVFALSERLHVVDGSVTGEAPQPDDEDLAALVERTAASHALLGHALRTEGELHVAVRLVEADTGLIVAAARADLTTASLVERGAMAWRPAPAAPAPRELLDRPPVQPAPESLPSTGSVAAGTAGVTDTPPPDEPQTAAPPTPLTAASQTAAPTAVATSPAAEPGGELAQASAPPEELVPAVPVDGPASIRLRRLARSRKGEQREDPQ